MDDFASKLGSIMSNPQMMSELKSLSSMLGLSDAQNDNKANDNSNEVGEKGGLLDASSTDTLSLITSLMPLLSGINKEDDTTRLLNSLRPFLSHERQAKLDGAIKLIKVIKLLPIIKETRLLDSLF